MKQSCFLQLVTSYWTTEYIYIHKGVRSCIHDRMYPKPYIYVHKMGVNVPKSVSYWPKYTHITHKLSHPGIKEGVFNAKIIEFF